MKRAFLGVALCATICIVFAKSLDKPWSSGINYDPCINSTGGEVTIQKVNVKGCKAPPCKLKRGTNVSISIQLKTKVTETKITNMVYGIIYGRREQYDGIPQPNGCKLGLNCPVPVGATQTESTLVPVPASAPKIPPISVEWALVDDHGKEQACFSLKVTLV